MVYDISIIIPKCFCFIKSSNSDADVPPKSTCKGAFCIGRWDSLVSLITTATQVFALQRNPPRTVADAVRRLLNKRRTIYPRKQAFTYGYYGGSTSCRRRGISP